MFLNDAYHLRSFGTLGGLSALVAIFEKRTPNIAVVATPTTVVVSNVPITIGC
jgi:hypothetical protein